MRLPRCLSSAALLALSWASAVHGQNQDVVEVVITDAFGNIRVITDDRGNVLARLLRSPLLLGARRPLHDCRSRLHLAGEPPRSAEVE